MRHAPPPRGDPLPGAPAPTVTEVPVLDRPAFYIWTLAGPVLTGVLITAALVIPALQGSLGAAIITSAVVGMLAAIPFSLYVERAIR